MPSRARPKPTATIVLAVAVGLLAIGAWVATLLVPNPQPPTVEAATAKVTAHLDRIEGTLPAAIVLDRSEEITRAACPLDGRGDQADVRRVVGIDPAFDRVGWSAGLSEAFSEADGWVVRVTALESRENLDIRIVGRDLIVIELTARGGDEQARIEMRSTSECSRAG
ncbi:hypothetical protein FLP10_13915 [Agromyces intestinalis]|uniref:Uncharacterized protein n=1 Tax=Agromyces intestinalis TaxID=2592652 RepID=A0A5C1YHE9_9MICO|nr:hypothetical protein [Agromyces intestinalis]QEO15401.1 hypothetical protein FLP10_13915 [Agromyces intestinalis]